MSGIVVAVSRALGHAFSKVNQDQIRLIVGQGVEGDAHCGETVKHRSRVRVDPTQPNLRQVHLIHGELFDELRQAGFSVSPGAMGENIATRGIDLLSLPTGTVLTIGGEAAVEITGLRNPCGQINDFQPGLLKAVLGRDAKGGLIRKAGVMAIVLRDGVVRTGDTIAIQRPSPPHRPLEPV
ncbi:MOSC domain-containing protein [Chelatococcus asaccharovorans]|uniref:MOSC domain-containing protein n=1 Tax=Chelatococcus asaccharovorans TaxID=28210 RepID=UPI00224C65B4|nr:MOSC domain-containing protein [Chelatococcus asaccharovorans]CAH1667107.1 MOSC domain-containing protein [Chelatococcus asaccharovorans]CAH1681153.1 MOSC domain-containing protein [Chelatococcus asaccharovorans]